MVIPQRSIVKVPLQLDSAWLDTHGLMHDQTFSLECIAKPDSLSMSSLTTDASLQELSARRDVFLFVSNLDHENKIHLKKNTHLVNLTVLRSRI